MERVFLPSPPPSLSLVPPLPPPIKQVERDAEDEEGYPMLHNHFEAFEAFVRDARETNEHAKVLVHCVAGLNRSGGEKGLGGLKGRD